MNDANAKTEKSLPAESAEETSPDTTRYWPIGDEETEPILPHEDLSNRMLGEFRLLRLLGRGGMAEVYLADQTSLSRKVAIKILRPELKTNQVFLKRFEREARAAASLSHPNIVQVFVVGEAEGLHFIAQEYVKGLNLREYIRRKGPPPVQLALHFMKQVLQALDKAGKAGIVHRDIKPENILITNKGVIKVADFGLAQLAQPEVDKSALELTQIGTTMGTPLYMSPEQVHGQKLDQRSDLYSFGVTCFHMLAGEPPFHGETAMAVAVQHLNTKPPRLRHRRPDLPPALCQVVHKMMAKDPEKRYPAAAAVLKDIKQIQTALKQDNDPATLHLSGFDVDVDDLDGAPNWPGRFSRWSLRRKLAVYVAACLLLAGASASFGWWIRPADPLDQPARTQSPIPSKRTAAEQYNLAEQNFSEDEDAWKAVIDRFPDPADQAYRYKAMEQLGLLYLKTLQLDQAAQVFQAMSQLEGGPLEAEYRTNALAGEIVLADLRGEPDRVEELLGQLELQKFNYRSDLGRYVEMIKQRRQPRFNSNDSG